MEELGFSNQPDTHQLKPNIRIPTQKNKKRKKKKRKKAQNQQNN